MSRLHYARARLGTALVLYCAALVAAFPAAAAPEWTRQFGTYAFDAFEAVAVDGAGNVVVAGQALTRWPVVAKYSTVGGLLWLRQLTAPSYLATATGVATDGAGNVIVASATRYPFVGWISKLGPQGNAVWGRQVGDWPQALAADATGNIYVAGYTYRRLGDIKYGSNNTDAWVAKVSPAGVVLWIEQIGTVDNEAANAVAVDKSGNVLVCGYTKGALAGPRPAENNDAWVAKLDRNGTVLWKSQLDFAFIGLRFLGDECNGIAADAAGNVLVGGTTSGKLAASWTPPDGWLAKYTAGGVRQWLRQYNRFGQPNILTVDKGFGIATDAGGNVYLAGQRSGAGSPDSSDGFYAKYSPSGTLLKEDRLRSGADDVILGVAIDKLGNILVAGSTLGTFVGSNAGGSDAVVAKFKP